ncbi:hypothetical protein JVU11DRAFT_12490 [Chiua virens]|nr:hypothetical protein JVU11DRAFT_12490 [Chiua virens]
MSLLEFFGSSRRDGKVMLKELVLSGFSSKLLRLLSDFAVFHPRGDGGRDSPESGTSFLCLQGNLGRVPPERFELSLELSDPRAGIDHLLRKFLVFPLENHDPLFRAAPATLAFIRQQSEHAVLFFTMPTLHLKNLFSHTNRRF